MWLVACDATKKTVRPKVEARGGRGRGERERDKRVGCKAEIMAESRSHLKLLGLGNILGDWLERRRQFYSSHV